MRNKLNQFVSNLNGQFVEVSYRPAEYQCYDLFYLWAFVCDIPKVAIQHGKAFEIWTLASDLTRQYFDLIENKLETIPEEGDVVVWGSKFGKYGHVAIVIEATQTSMKVFEQNDPLGTHAHIQDRKSYKNVLGFLRPKNIIIPSIPKWFETLLQEQPGGLTIQDESKIRDVFEDSKKVVEKETLIGKLNERLGDFNEALRRLDVKGGDSNEEALAVLENAVQELLDLREKQNPEPRIIIAEKEMSYIKIWELFIGVIKAGDKHG